MSVRKHIAAPECQQHAKEHIVATCSDGPLTKRDLTGLHKYREQRVLTLNHVRADSLAFLEEWHEIRSLTMFGCKIPDCSALTRLRELEHLWYHINRDKAPDLSFMSALKHIESLGIGYVTYLTSLPDLSYCKRLKKLTVFNCSSLRDIPDLSHCKRLKELTVLDCNSLRDIDSVTRIPKLESFSITCTSHVPRDLEKIMAMKTLRTMSGAFGSKNRDEEFHQLLEQHGLKYG